MYAQVEKPKVNKSKAVTNFVGQKKSNGKQGFGFVDNRPKSVVQSIQGSVKQLSTTLNYDNEPVGKKGTSSINAISHERSSVNSAAKTAALNNGQWSNRPAGSVANHSKPYADIWAILEPQLQGVQLGAAAAVLSTKFGNLPYVTAAGGHAATLANLQNPNAVVAKDNITNAFDYYISRIADYPDNIFYWPDQTNANPDEPATDYGTGATAIPLGWIYNGVAQVNDTSAPRVAPINTEKARLATGRGALTAAGL